jgi:3-oxoadipate enol-lactonase
MRVATPVGRLSVEVSGQGPAVVLWHSFLHHGGMWNAQVEALSAHFRVLNVDAPGHGRSDVIRRPLTMADCADAVLAVLDHEGIDRAAMCGLSWGGMVAMKLATIAPERLWSMALFDTSCRTEPRLNRAKYVALGTLFTQLGAVPRLMQPVEKLLFGPRARRGGGPLIEDWRAYVARLDRPSVWQALRCIFERADLTAQLSRVRIPTLVGVGEDDAAQPIAESRAIAAAIAGARLVVFPSSGHLSALESPAPVNDALLAFLLEHQPATDAA